MNRNIFLINAILLLLFLPIIHAQEENETLKGQTSKLSIPAAQYKMGKVSVAGKTIDYTATSGYLSIKNEKGEEQAHIFYIAYTKNYVGDITKRPITFSFNGGPGSSSVWLHMGMLGPKRVLMTDEGLNLTPPYRIVDNDYSWLDMTDLVFIDPVSTGFSIAADVDKSRTYHGFDNDIESVGEFIRRYITTNNRWGSPKYIIGESYGTTRAAGLSDHLINEYGLFLNGVILVSQVMNFQTIMTSPGNDLPYPMFLPSMAATAWYHQLLKPEYQEKELQEFLDEVEKFSENQYVVALMQGDQLNETQVNEIAGRLHDYTSLPVDYIKASNLRLLPSRFFKDLMIEDQTVVGRFDSRIKSKQLYLNSSTPEFDPSYPIVMGPYSTAINDYLTRELNFETYLPYRILNSKVHPWDFSSFQNKYINVSDNLRKAMYLNKEMKVWIANGYFDLATPYFASKYTINHMQLTAELKSNIRMTYYYAGHMMYTHKESLILLKQDAEKYFELR